jgi:hypothetical protein
MMLVDTGQCGILDEPSWRRRKEEATIARWPLYNEACTVIDSSKSRAGILGDKKGVVSASGYGDGRYLLYGLDYGGEYTALALDFITLNMNIRGEVEAIADLFHEVLGTVPLTAELLEAYVAALSRVEQ